MRLPGFRLTSPARWGAALPAGLLAACVSYGPQALPPRSTLDQARAEMGAPSGEYALAQGGTRLEFARGPYGKHTWMLDFDASGRLVSTQQVLTVAQFEQLLPGMTTDEVLRRIGHPSERSLLPWQHRTLWSYRYEGPFCLWYQLGIDADGRVVDGGYGTDPACAESRREADM